MKNALSAKALWKPLIKNALNGSKMFKSKLPSEYTPERQDKQPININPNIASITNEKYRFCWKINFSSRYLIQKKEEITFK